MFDYQKIISFAVLCETALFWWPFAFSSTRYTDWTKGQATPSVYWMSNGSLLYNVGPLELLWLLVYEPQ